MILKNTHQVQPNLQKIRAEQSITKVIHFLVGAFCGLGEESY